jgi:disulfide bond formation protein DsbB
VFQLLGTRRRVCATVFVAVAGLLLFSLVLQHYVGLEPCPLCILQRYAFVLVALSAVVAAVTPDLPSRIAHGLAALAALAGGGVAAWHVWLQYNPPEESSCGPGLAYMLGELPLARALPRIFQGGGDCTAVDWRFLGLSIAGWALVWFAILFVLLIATLRRRA